MDVDRVDASEAGVLASDDEDDVVLARLRTVLSWDMASLLSTIISDSG